MSKRLVTNLLKSIFARLGDDKDFRCSDTTHDLYVWVELTVHLNDTEMFRYLPVAINSMWKTEEYRRILVSHDIKKLSPTLIQSIAANVVSLRRQTKLPDFEKVKLGKTISFLNQEFNALSTLAYELLQENEFLRFENERLSQELNLKQMDVIAYQENQPLLKVSKNVIVSLPELSRLSQNLPNDKILIRN
jgi:regulator of replication initiation timing